MSKKVKSIKTDGWQLRYARQIALNGWGEVGQQMLAQKRVMIVGLGGLGSPVATYLACAGVGDLILNDFDQVDETNLARQPLHGVADIDKSKTQSAYQSLRRINPTIDFIMVNERLDGDTLEQMLRTIDVVVDCSDNFSTRFLLNDAAVATKTPLVSAAAIRMEGQAILFRNDLADSPCYRCLIEESDESIEDCQGQGVMTPLVGVIGSLAATLVLNFLVLSGEEYGYLHCFDANHMNWQKLKVKKDSQCSVCS